MCAGCKLAILFCDSWAEAERGSGECDVRWACGIPAARLCWHGKNEMKLEAVIAVVLWILVSGKDVHVHVHVNGAVVVDVGANINLDPSMSI